MYNLDEYLKPLWEGSVVYDESVMVVRDNFGNVPLQPLAYKATRIISVKNAALTVEYFEGTDYLLEDGMLKILESGKYASWIMMNIFLRVLRITRFLLLIMDLRSGGKVHSCMKSR
jgi:hypothetical protein